MPLRSVARILALSAALVSAGGAWAQPDSTSFVFSLSGIPLGEMVVTYAAADATYTASSRVSATGLLGAFTSFGFDGTSSGRITAAGTVEPQRFVAESSSPRADRHTEIDWQDGTPIRVSVVPPRKNPPDPAAQAGALDPVSAGFALLRDAAPERICDVTMIVFDGSRRSRLSVGPPQPEADKFVCSGRYARIQGEAHSLSNQREFPFTIVFRPQGSGMVEVERVETSTRFGLAVVARRD